MARLLSQVPEAFEVELFDKYREIERNFREARWEPSALNGGKFCEAAYSILRGHVDGKFPAMPSKPAKFADACRDLEKAAPSFGRSVRLLIPRVLIAMYDIRNSRSIGHIGGDVDPNHMDALCVLHMAKWVISEIIRLFHGVSVEEAQSLVEAISDREVPLVWSAGGTRRVLSNALSMLEKTLVLLYGSTEPVSEAELVKSVEHSNSSVYRRDVLRKAHKARLIEYDPVGKTAMISPLGSARVETDILPRTRS